MRKLLIAGIGIFLLFVVSGCALSEKKANEESVARTNMNQVQILPYGEESEEPYIIYDDGSKEMLNQEYIGLFINGSIIKNANVTAFNDHIFVPLAIIAEHLGAQLEWNDVEGTATLEDGENKVEVVVGNKSVKLNGQVIQLDAVPERLHEDLFVPVSFVAQVLKGNVHYYDGTDADALRIVERMPHVMISRYPENRAKLSQEEAVNKAREQLITAFEKKYGTYTPLEENVQVEQYDDEAMLRKTIANLTVKMENDRYYVLPVVYDFWVDKYTGDVYTYYNGLVMDISEFDPKDKNALAFPG
ncbi:copper amine oxidase N-terminal domain-containing protein [Paenibacillus macerans]|uniref:copper amine oxidase N-terminal domain-containing protein n=1 Tax=Paenibacillus macerans TaxID=44252 RepID=UPI00203B3BB7|nr:copper amine oxidase N-terminal domain-containing protein [Paenibacillus macerans]MCM3701956.1 copper amine oxidase N-terminal domain-containing protein [Paenibacillus macerans]